MQHFNKTIYVYWEMIREIGEDHMVTVC